ncbi:MAG TPA: TerB family tellurite resistance protein [Beijerinckiaceae bacterium]|jgi:uncharacterized tellurite resistance protein B-like protein
MVNVPLFNTLIELAARTFGPLADERRAPEDDQRLAIAALLLHVARADGRLRDADRARLAALFQFWFRLPADEAKRLVARGDLVDRETHSLATLVGMAGHDTPVAERRELLAMAYTVAAVDGAMQEFEDDLVWRVGQLLGLDDQDIVAVKDATLGGTTLSHAVP